MNMDLDAAASAKADVPTGEACVGPVVIYSGEYGLKPDVKSPSVFIQWKGTNVCQFTA